MKKPMILAAMTTTLMATRCAYAQTSPSDAYAAAVAPLLPTITAAKIAEDCGLRPSTWYGAVEEQAFQQSTEEANKVWNTAPGDPSDDETQSTAAFVGKVSVAQVSGIDAAAAKCDVTRIRRTLGSLDALATQGGYHPAAPAPADQKTQIFQTDMQPNLYADVQARLIEHCGLRPDSWYQAVVEYLLANAMTVQTNLWGQTPGATGSAALDAFLVEIDKGEGQADLSPPQECSFGIDPSMVPELDADAGQSR